MPHIVPTTCKSMKYPIGPRNRGGYITRVVTRMTRARHSVEEIRRVLSETNTQRADTTSPRSVLRVYEFTVNSLGSQWCFARVPHDRRPTPGDLGFYTDWALHNRIRAFFFTTYWNEVPCVALNDLFPVGCVYSTETTRYTLLPGDTWVRA